MRKVIPNWEKYDVSETGLVRNRETGHILPLQLNTAGYLRIILYSNKSCKKFFLHRLVANLYIPNPLNLPEVNHIDGNKYNNNVSNLEWCDRTYNERHGRKKYPHKYKPFVVTWENGNKSIYEFSPDLGERLSVTRACVRNWLKGRSNSFLKYGISSIHYLSQ